jgi:RNA polymerase sigma factor (sigma-70 family)
VTESVLARSDVLAEAMTGDEDAFARIVAEHHGDMRRVCAIVCGDAPADEAVQAAWPIAWRELHSVRRPDRLRAWLVSIAVNEARQMMRRARRRERLSLVHGMTEPTGGSDPAQGIDLIDLRAALDRLDPDDRALLAMRYVAGFNATVGSVSVWRGSHSLRRRLELLQLGDLALPDLGAHERLDESPEATEAERTLLTEASADAGRFRQAVFPIPMDAALRHGRPRHSLVQVQGGDLKRDGRA